MIEQKNYACSETEQEQEEDFYSTSGTIISPTRRRHSCRRSLLLLLYIKMEFICITSVIVGLFCVLASLVLFVGDSCRRRYDHDGFVGPFPEIHAVSRPFRLVADLWSGEMFTKNFDNRTAALEYGEEELQWGTTYIVGQWYVVN